MEIATHPINAPWLREHASGFSSNLGENWSRWVFHYRDQRRRLLTVLVCLERQRKTDAQLDLWVWAGQRELAQAHLSRSHPILPSTDGLQYPTVCADTASSVALRLSSYVVCHSCMQHIQFCTSALCWRLVKRNSGFLNATTICCTVSDQCCMK